MFANVKSSRRFGLLAATLALVAAPAAALAISVVAWAYDPTRYDVYYQFSTDVPFDAYRSEVRLPGPGGPIVGTTFGRNPLLPATGGAGEHHGLTPGTSYVLRVYVREVPGGPWTKVKTQGFMTDP